MLRVGVRRPRAVVTVTAALLISLTACTSAGTPENGPTSINPVPPASAPATAAASPRESVTVDCATSRPIDSARPAGPGDLVIGPLRYDGIARGYPGAISDSLNYVVFATIGTELLPDATVTVSVAPGAREWAGIATEGGPPAGFFSVTYTSCPASRDPNGVWWVGGFTLRNRTSGCLPLDVHVLGEPSPRRAVISFSDASCATGET
jgi:hypothetical protein